MKLKIILSLLFLSANAFCQISISNTNEIAKIRSGTTFFAMKDPDSPKAAQFVEIIRKNWTLSKVECIKYSDVEKNIAPNNFFVTIGASMTSSSSSTKTDFFLEFWTTNGKFAYDPKKRRHFSQEDKIVVAAVSLFPDYTTQDNPSSLYKMDYDAAGHLKNWSVGIFANYIQQVVALLSKSEERYAKTEFLNKEELGNLETLYIPDYVLTKFSKNSNDESKKIDPKEITEASRLDCKIISKEALNDKIVNEEAPFYYLLLIKSNTDKWITVTNSKSGEIIYAANSGPGNFKAADLNDLQKAAQKK